MMELKKGEAHFFTQQLFLIGTNNEDGSANFAPISWVSYTWGPPCCLVVSIYRKEGRKRTVQNLDRTGLLSATVVTPELLPFAEQCSRGDRPKAAAIAELMEGGRELQVPLLRGAKWSFECEVIQTVQIGGCSTYFAAIRQENVREDIQKLEFVDLRVIDPVVYSPNHYFRIGEFLGEIGDYTK